MHLGVIGCLPRSSKTVRRSLLEQPRNQLSSFRHVSAPFSQQAASEGENCDSRERGVGCLRLRKYFEKVFFSEIGNFYLTEAQQNLCKKCWNESKARARKLSLDPSAIANRTSRGSSHIGERSVCRTERAFLGYFCSLCDRGHKQHSHGRPSARNPSAFHDRKATVSISLNCDKYHMFGAGPCS